ncbi:hypothetical protein KEM56_004482, partial [Ascosphaera pollenicola]
MSIPNVKRRKLNDATEHPEGSQDAPVTTGHAEHLSSSQSRHDASAELASANGLYKSSLFKLQVDELLSQLRPDHQKLLSRVEQPLRKLKEIIENLPNVPAKSVKDAEKYLKSEFSTLVPFPDPRPAGDSKYTFEYSRPTSINLEL